MLGVGAGAPALRAPPAVAVVTPLRLPPLFSSLRRRRPTAAAAAYKQKEGKKRRWWSDAEQEEEYEDDFFTGSSFGGELFDEPWFSKVFKTYGFLLPVMLASMLVATGPRAFLMAMAIPLVQSAVSFLLEAIWGRNGRRRRRQEAPFVSEGDEEEEDEEDFRSDFAETRGSRDSSSGSSYSWGGGRRRAQSYQSWVSDDFDAASADNSTKKSGGFGFGGWDELLDKDDAAARATRSSSDANAYRRTAGTAAPRLSRRRPRMSASTKYKQAPLLMRLMVAVFPFLGSWFRLL